LFAGTPPGGGGHVFFTPFPVPKIYVSRKFERERDGKKNEKGKRKDGEKN